MSAGRGRYAPGQTNRNKDPGWEEASEEGAATNTGLPVAASSCFAAALVSRKRRAQCSSGAKCKRYDHSPRLNFDARHSHQKGANPMATERSAKLQEILAKSEKEILEEWLKGQLAATTLRKDLLSEADLRRESAEFLSLFAQAISSGTL